MFRISMMVMAGVVVGLTGCGGDSGPALVPVHGQVTLDGKPLAGKTLKFVPDGTTPGQGAGGTTDANGKYSLIAARPGAITDMVGAPAGAYRVVVVEPLFPMDLPVQSATASEATVAIGLPSEPKKTGQAVPSVYSTPETTTLKVQVPNEGGQLDLALTSKPK